jgi:hypothetical protein
LVGVWADGGLTIFFSELSNCKHDLLQIARYCFSGSPPGVVNHSESLVMSKNMKKKHYYLFFDIEL